MKAQMIGGIFVYVISLIIMALILFYGYKAINSFIHTGEDITLLQAKNKIKTSVDEVGYQYGRVEQKNIPLPVRFKKLCFIDLNKYASATSSNICDTTKTIYNPLICESWSKKVQKNLFFVESKTKIEPFYIGEIVVDGDGDGNEDTSCAPIESCFHLCIDVNNGKASFWIKGLGDRAFISKEAPS